MQASTLSANETGANREYKVSLTASPMGTPRYIFSEHQACSEAVSVSTSSITALRVCGLVARRRRAREAEAAYQ